MVLSLLPHGINVTLNIDFLCFSMLFARLASEKNSSHRLLARSLRLQRSGVLLSAAVRLTNDKPVVKDILSV